MESVRENVDGNQNMDRQKIRELFGKPALFQYKVATLFEFSVAKPKMTFYRGVRARDGSFRLEKKGENAKSFRAVMWCGSEESLRKFRESIEVDSKR